MLIRFTIKGEPAVVEVPSTQALVEYMNDTAQYRAGTATEYMREYAQRAVINNDTDIRATDFNSFVADLIKLQEINIVYVKMNGEDFYNFLKNHLKPDQLLHPERGYCFVQWLHGTDLQFTIPGNNSKSIPHNLIIAAKEAYNHGDIINEQWFKDHRCNRGWCLPILIKHLFHEYRDDIAFYISATLNFRIN